MGAGVRRLLDPPPRRGHEPQAVRAGRVADRRRPRRPRPDPGHHDRLAAGHPHLDFAGTWEWTFGGRRQPPAELVDFSPSAAVALERFWATMDRWRDSVAAVTPEQLDTVGYSQYPYSDAAELRFILLRDLYRTHPAGAR